MDTNWREVPRGDTTPAAAGLKATMNLRGHISWNRFTHERLGRPEAVRLLFDPPNNRIGLQPVHPTTKNAYPVGPQGLHGGRIIRAYRLLNEYGIRLTETVEFPNPEIDREGILVLDLRTTRPSTRSAGRLRRKPDGGSTSRPMI
jgi:hypothetical protein